MRYQWKPGSRFAVRADVAGPELERIRRAAGGELRPPDVVEAARPEEAPLHEAFTWNDAEAAEKYRLVEARQIIHSVVIVKDDDGEEKKELAYVHVTTESTGPCYMTSARVLSDEDLRDAALTEALTLLEGVRRRFEHLEELAEVYKAIDAANRRRSRRKKVAAT